MLTPQEVSTHSFAKASFGGYNMAMVDEFLDELTDDYTALYKENAALKAKLKVLVEKVEELRLIKDRHPILGWPLIRGTVNFLSSMVNGVKALMYSADFFPEEENAEPSKFEKWLDEKFGDKLVKVIMVFASILGVALAVALFFFLPSFLFDLTANVVPVFQGDGEGAVFWKSVFEGVLKIALFLGYIVLCSQMTEMKRVFMYHGAEHKTIFCYENEEELTVENVRKQIRFHPRCGTSFMVLMLIVGIVIGLFIPVAPFGIGFLRPVFKILLLPVSCGVGYELIKICGKHDNAFTRFIAAPGLWAQRITTKEPDDKMIEVAIEAMKAVIPDDGTDIINNK